MRLATRMMVVAWFLGPMVAGSDSPAANPPRALAQLHQAGPIRTVAYQARQVGSQPSARWIGQDGHDYVGPSNRLEPSEVQDMHIALSGLDPQKEIEFIDVTTEKGGDQWQYNAQSFSWKAELKRGKGSRTADLFLEPGHNDSVQNYFILLRYEGGATRELVVRCRKVNRGLRMPGAGLQARWGGQDRQDRVGDGPSVGPDGLQDSRIRLSGVSTKIPVKAMRIEGPGGAKWESGANPQLLPNAEYWADPKKPGEGDLFFQPERDLKGQKLRVLVLYANETMDSAAVVAGRGDPKLKMPEQALPRLVEVSATARWHGQDGQDVTGPGDVHVTVSGLGRTQGIVGAVLTDSVRGTWIYRSSNRVKLDESSGDVTGPLAVRPGPDRSSIELFFAPYRDEAKATLTLRLVDQDGRMTVSRFPGGACDPGRRSPLPAPTRVEARPGDDLNALARQHGTVVLAPGTYRLDRPLVLEKPVTLTSEGKATLVLAQASTDTPWTAAIKVHCGHTTLNGFAVRFEGPIRWDQEVSYGPAVIGTTDNHDQGHDDLKFGVVITRLDLEIPPPADPAKWVEAMRLIRLTNARSGMIAGNILRGGVVEFFGGPWQVINNDYRGTPPGTFSHGVFTGHGTYDLVLQGNRAKPVEPAGKTWRFLVLTHQGTNDRVTENFIEDLGAREGDTIPWANAPEIILTEGYHLTYEGKLAALSADGRLIRIHHPQGHPAGTGDVVSLLTGPAAGQYRKIAQALDPSTYLVNSPIPKGTEVVSISRGFVDEVFEENRIDTRGGKLSDGMVLVGNHFGTRVVKNHLLGGAHALRFSACPSETPVTWGWSHAPFLGTVIEENVLEDAEKGSLLGLEHSAKDIKSAKGRTYMAIALNRNTVRWSEPFLRRQSNPTAGSLPGLTLGFPPSHDPGELVVKASGNRLEAPPGVKAGAGLIIHAAVYNSQRMVNRKFGLMSEARNVEGGRPRAQGPGPDHSGR
jgi:hypothetical protein